jgi:hypothetical protein
LKGDFTRSTFNDKKHYSGVRMQQGRVALDADWNELADIDKHRQETGTKDMIGPSGVPINNEGVGDGFKIMPDGSDLSINQGRIYVDGILCENQDEKLLITKQKDLPNYVLDMPVGKYLAYLDVWQRHITAIEDPDIREVALGGPDTATRTKTVWQVKLLKLTQPENCISVLQKKDWTDLSAQSGLMSAFTKTQAQGKDPCIISPTSGYKRLENQLYRVEIHKGGKSGKATFKWSRDNGSMVFAINKFFVAEPKKIELENLGRNKNPALSPGQWVEILDDSTELWGKPGIIALIEDVDPASRIITLNTEISGNDINGMPMVHPKVRRWDMTCVLDKNKNPLKDLKDGIPITSGEIELESGIFISFDFDGKEYRTGDYWLIPARTESTLNPSGTIQWPEDKSKPNNSAMIRPQGIQHHYCSLALLDKKASSWDLLGDCRPLFPAVTDLTGLFYIGGDGQEAMPGEELPEPVQVGVSNGRWPVDGAFVKFEISEGGGSLGATNIIAAGNFEQKVSTVNGIATCYWKLGDILDDDNPVPPKQQVKATLLDANDDPVHLPIYFNANLSVASEVAYKPTSQCSQLAQENHNHTNLRTELNISDSNYSSVAQILDALLCRFNADDLPIEKNDELCKTLQDDTSIITVQDALNKLCQNHQGICTQVIGPRDGWETIFDTIKEGQDANICFQVGTYVINKPIVLKNKGHIRISGSGPGTRIKIPTGETIFEFDGCKSVVVKDLYGESGVAGFDREKKLNSINGILTFCACPKVTVRTVELRCAAWPERAASCINVRDAVDYPHEGAVPVESVHIHNCDLHIGLMQVGILLINVQNAHVEDNSLNVSKMPGSQPLQVLLQNKRYRSAIRSLMIPAAHLGRPENDNVFLGGDVVGIKAGKGFVWFKPDLLLVNAWERWFRISEPKGVQSDRDLLFHLIHVADQVLLNNGILNANDRVYDGFKKWYDELNKSNLEAGSQGIVIGGSSAGNINILNNRIQGVIQGIHAGISHHGVSPNTHDTAGIVHILNNSIDVLLPSYATRERHGIFVGNCNSLIIQNNFSRAARTDRTLDLKIEGIRVHGHIGKMMIIRQNHLIGYTKGIHFWPINDGSGTYQWVITDNMAEGSIEEAFLLLPEEWNDKWSVEKQKKLTEKSNILRKIIRGLNYNFM